MTHGDEKHPGNSQTIMDGTRGMDPHLLAFCKFCPRTAVLAVWWCERLTKEVKNAKHTHSQYFPEYLSATIFVVLTKAFDLGITLSRVR